MKYSLFLLLTFSISSCCIFKPNNKFPKPPIIGQTDSVEVYKIFKNIQDQYYAAVKKLNINDKIDLDQQSLTILLTHVSTRTASLGIKYLLFGSATYLEKLLIPEVSLWGFTIDYHVFLASNLEINGESNVLGKAFLYTNPTDTSEKTNEVAIVFHQKIGAEWIIMNNIISIYSNYNILTPLEDVSKFNEYYSVNNQTFHFFDLGLKLYLNLSSDNKTTFLFQPDVIFNSKDIKLLSNSQDVGFLNFKFSLLKQLN